MTVEVLLIVGNGLLWVLLMLGLKKKLSPEGVMKDVRKELEGLLLQINSASDRNIRLIQNQIEQLKTASLEAEQLCAKVEERLAMLYGELDKASAVKTVEDRLYPSELPSASDLGTGRETPAPEASIPNAVPSAPAANRASDAPAVHDDTLSKSYSPVDSYMKEQMRFASDVAEASSGEKAPENPHRIEIPEFIKAETPLEIKKPFRQQVMEMKALGYTIEEIAHETGRSTQEVKITIEFS
jgi:hypothetical protein